MDELQERLQKALPKRYTLDRVFRRGGMGIVFLAREEHPNRQVAIKVLDPSITARMGRERFLREIDLASKLTHPNIVPIFSAGEVDGMLYYVMPFVAGESLGERVAREAQLPIDEALRIAADIAGALEHAHQQNVVHRDIKPGNILLFEGHALVTDFGVARAISVAGGDDVTETGIALGTPAYMSPEQITAESEVDGRADVYALGAVLYEMLAGEPPFSGRDSRAILARQMVDPVPSLRTLRDTVPVSVENTVTAALAKTPADRIPTARQFEQALGTARTELGTGWVTPQPGATGAFPRPRAQTWRRSVAAAILAFAAVAVGWQVWTRPANTMASGIPYLDSLAVMPLENLTGDAQYDHLSTGITEEIITHLTQLSGLKVISRHSAEALQASALTTQQLADSLGVRHILRGALRLDGSQLRVTVQDIDAHTDANVWADTYSGDLNDVFSAQEEIAGQIMIRVANMAPGIQLPDTTTHVSHGPGHEAYLLGQHWLSRRTPEGIQRAIESFAAAITADSAYALASAGLSTAYALSLTYRYDVGLGEYAVAGRAFALAGRAIDLNPQLANGYTARGYIGAIAGAPDREVVADFARAAALQPNAPSIPSWSARILAKTGRMREAFSETQRARDLDPLSASRRVGVAYWALRLGDYEMAARESRVALAVEPELMLPRAIAARSLLLDGEAAQCEAMDLGPHAVIRATCLHELGRTTEARAIVDSVITSISTPSDADPAFSDVAQAEDLAVHFAWTGDVNASLTWVERAFEQSPSGIEAMVLESALFDGIRDDARFRSEIERIRSGIWDRVLRTR